MSFMPNSSLNLASSDIVLTAWILGFCWFLLLEQLPNMTALLLLLAASLGLLLKIRSLAPIIGFLLASCYANWSYLNLQNSQLPTQFESVSIGVVGSIIGLPNSNQSHTKFRLKIGRVTNVDNQPLDGVQFLSGKYIDLNCYRCDFEILPDQVWQLTVRLKQPHGYASWGAFDFEKYLFRNQVVARGYVRENETNLLISANTETVDSYRWQIKQHLNHYLEKQTPAKAMIAALTIGDKSFFTNQQRKTLQTTGVSHLMAISGLHIALVFFAVSFLLKWALMPIASVFNWQPRQCLVMLPALMAAFSYAALAGFAVSTQRAFVMLCVFVICRFFSREITLTRVLLISASMILAIDPFSILDVGFWLSCVAVLVIAVVNIKSEQQSLLRLQPLLWLGMIPITVLFFGQISVISPLVNLIMVPLFCLLLIPLVLLSLLFIQLGVIEINLWLLSYLAQALDFVFQILEWCKEIPFALIFPSHINLIQMGLLLLASVSFWFKWKLRWLTVFIAVLLLSIDRQNIVTDEVQMTLLDVGQGLSIVVEVDDYVLVYDTGPSYPSGFNAVDAVLLPYLRHKGINKIDDLIISHADNDHFGGFNALIDAIEVEQIYTSRLDKIPTAKSCTKGLSWSVKGVQFDMLSPVENSTVGGNDDSCVLSIKTEKFRALLTGDIEKYTERYLTSINTNLNAEFLLVPHHGSKTSSSEAFIDAVSPDIAFIAAGYRNRYRHPHRDIVTRYENRNIKLVSTAESGSTILKFDNDKWNVVEFRKSNRHFWNHQIMPN